ncbi:MAG: hypothetical protein MJ181_01145 [Treponema sp.]|nr:hypothetical protein [Treponema sp.]
MKRIFSFLILLLSLFSAAWAELPLDPGVPIHSTKETKPDLKHNWWELIIYRPQNTEHINDIRCWLRIEDMDGNDVTCSAAKATYEWVSIPDVVNKYQKSYWLSGGVAMHLNIKAGRYKMTVYTPSDKQWPYPSENREEWKSNEFIYDTENPAKVIFVYPGMNENGFYDGRWILSGRSPKYFKQATIPEMKKN